LIEQKERESKRESERERAGESVSERTTRISGTLPHSLSLSLTESSVGDMITVVDGERVWGGVEEQGEREREREAERVTEGGLVRIVARRRPDGHLVPLSLTPASLVPLRPRRVVDSANRLELLLANEIEREGEGEGEREGEGGGVGWEKGSVVSRAWASDAFATAIPPGYRLSRSGWKKEREGEGEEGGERQGESGPDDASSSSSASIWSSILSSPSASLATPATSSGLGDSRFVSHIRAVAAFSGAKVQRNLALAKKTAIGEGEVVGGEAQGAALADLVAQGEREKERRSVVGHFDGALECTRAQALAALGRGETYICPDARPPLDPTATSPRYMFDFTHLATSDLDPQIGTFRLYLGLLDILEGKGVLDTVEGQAALAEKAETEEKEGWASGSHCDGQNAGLLLPLLQYAVTSTTLSLSHSPKPLDTLRLFALLDTLITFELVLGPRIIKKITLDKIVTGSEGKFDKALARRLCEHFGLRSGKSKHHFSFPSRSRVKLKAYIVALWMGPCTGYTGAWVPDIAAVLRVARKEVMRVVRFVGGRLKDNVVPTPVRVFNHTNTGMWACLVDGEPLEFPDEMISVEQKKRKRIAV
jgi:hypothetical protein